MRRRKRLAYFLDRFPDEPTELTPGKTCLVGRGAGSSVFIPDVGVSRCHAEIRWRDGAFVILDLGSANGTFVNGERIFECILEPGDLIRIGSRGMSFRIEDVSSISASYRRNKEQMCDVSTAVDYRPLEGGLAGAIADVPLPEIIQILERTRKTGRLYVSFAGSHGTVSFREGRIITAEWLSPEGGETADHEAAYAILALEDGVFEFVGEAVTEEPGISQPTQALLLESMRRMDERSRADARAARGDETQSL